MKILITGGSGMVGKNVLAILSSQDHELLYPNSTQLDLANFKETIKYLKKNKPDFIIHSAGYVGGIQANISHPVNFLVNNLDIGRNIIFASYQAGIKKVLNLGSSCMYPRNAPNPLSEEMILNGKLEPTNEGYALAKIVTARLCGYIHSENPNFQYKTMIPCNIYGCYDNFDPDRSHLIPAIHPYVSVATGKAHGDDYVIEDYKLGVSTSAKIMATTIVDLLANGGSRASEIIDQYSPGYTKNNYLSLLRSLAQEETYE